MDDHALLAEFAVRGNAEALGELVRRYEPLVRAAALRQVGDAHLAQDITQGTMLALMRKARRIRGGTPLGPWLLRVTYYLATDALRSESARRKHERLAARQRQECVGNSPCESSGVSPWRSLEPVLDQTLHQMRQRDRTVLVMRYLQGWDVARIADELNLTPTTTRQRLSRALRRLRERLARRGVGREDLAILLPLLPAESEFDPHAKSGIGQLWRLLYINTVTAIVAVAIISGGFVATRAAWHRTPAGLAAGAKSVNPPPPINSRPNPTIP